MCVMAYVQELSKQCFFYLLKNHERYGYTSLETIGTWNRVYLNKKNVFSCKKLERLIEGEVSRGSLTAHMKYRLALCPKRS